MFTGIIEEIGIVNDIRKDGDGVTISLSCEKILDDLKIGDSVSLNGACQTVTKIGSGGFSVFASKITMNLTTLGGMNKNDQLNLERAMTPRGRMGGHIVQGHVDGTGRVVMSRRDQSGISFLIEVDVALARYIAPRGSIAVDGISLTVVGLEGNRFSLYLIPESVRATTAVAWKQGDRVNVEVDILAKYVEGLLNRNESGDESMLKNLAENGFL